MRAPSQSWFSAAIALLLLIHPRGQAVVTPAPDRAFATNSAGTNIIALMEAEARNPLLSNVVVRLLDSNTAEKWSGVLISSNWILTCAHTLPGTNGVGGGIVPTDIFFNFGDSSIEPWGEIAEVHIHPSWTNNNANYTNGSDIALLRLAVPVTHVTTFPRLPVTVFTQPTPVLFAGYGMRGDGGTGENPALFGDIAVGVNSLDGRGGDTFKDGYNQEYRAYSNWVSSVAFMDFDRWELAQFPCTDPMNVPYTNTFPAGLSDYSIMGENEVADAVQACASPIQAVQGYFDASICDFLPASGDSGGPSFEWPGAPALPTGGNFVITATPTILAVNSFRLRGMRSTNYASSHYGNATAVTLVQPHVGWIYQVTQLPHAAPVTAIRKPYDVEFLNIRIVSEQPAGAGQTDIEFTADLRNADTGVYRDLELKPLLSELPVSVAVVDSSIAFSSLSPTSTVSTASDTLVIRVDNADVATARAVILSGTALDLYASEEQIYVGPTKYLDQPTDDAFAHSTTFNLLGELVLIFNSQTALIGGLQSGDILIADPTPGAYKPEQRSPTAQDGIPYLGELIPFEVSSVSTVNGKIHVAGHKRELWEILKSGTFTANDDGPFRDLYDPSIENTYTHSERQDRTNRCEILKETDPNNGGLTDLCGLNALPWHFNELKITDHLLLSGQIMLRSSGLRTELSFRNFALKRASVGIDAGVVASLVLETRGSNNNVSVPIGQKQHELLKIPMPVLPITVAGVPCTIGMNFVLAVGAEANAPGGLSIPLETSITVGTEIGWTNGNYFTAPIAEFVAPHVSNPTVFDAVNLNAKAWAEAKFQVSFSVAGGLAKAGPSLAIRAEAGFEVAPFNDPWWTLDAGAELIGAFELDFFGLNVARVDATNDLGTFFHREANGALINPPLAAAKTAKRGGTVESLAPKEGEEVRWGLAFAAATASGASYSKGFVEPLMGGGYFIGGGSAIPSFLGVVSRTGNVQWMQHFPTGAKPVDAEELPDGSVIVAGSAGHDWWLAKYDTNGGRQWVKSYRMTSTDLRDLARGTAPNGDAEFYLAGFHNVPVVTQSDPMVLKLDKDGNFVWSKVFTHDRDDEVYAIRALRDGNFLLTGDTDARVGTDLFIGAGNNGLVMKMSPNGEIVWANSIAARWGMLFRDVAEAPDGTLYVVGSHGDIVWNYYPSIMVAKFSPDGALLNHVLIGEDPDWPDELPSAGDTPYDTATQCAWSDNGLIIVGNTGLGNTATAFAACVNEELGVRWFSAFDGPKGTTFEDVALTDAGIVAMGGATDVWPSLFTNRSPAILLSLPWEGMMRFHPHANVQSKYLQPRVFLSTGHLDFMGRYTDENQHQFFINTAPINFATSNAILVAGANVIAGVATTFHTARLERIEPSLVDTYAEWTAYHQMSGTNSTPATDYDRDGIANGAEFFFGGDPLMRSTNTPLKLGIQYDRGAGTVSVDFQRGRAAICQPFDLQYTTDFQSWTTITNSPWQVVGSDSLYDWLKATFPQPATNHAFFRVAVPFP